MVLSGCYNLPFLLDLYECFTVPNLKALAPDFSMKNVVKVNEFFIFKIFTEFVGSRWIYADWEKKLPNFKVQNAIFLMSNVRRTYNSNLITAIFFLRETAILYSKKKVVGGSHCQMHFTYTFCAYPKSKKISSMIQRIFFTGPFPKYISQTWWWYASVNWK